MLADNDDSMAQLKSTLSSRFEMKFLGQINWLLGFAVTRNLKDRTITISQRGYLERIIKRFGQEHARPVTTPMEPGIDLSVDSPSVSPTLLTPSEVVTYREAVGSLQYASRISRADITYSVSIVACYMHEPHTTHWVAVIRIYRYLNSTLDFVLILGGHGPLSVHGFSDADWGQLMHRHSYSGYVFFFGNGAISWSAKKQPIVTLSSTESEYVALTHASKELIWIRKLFSELFHPMDDPTTLCCDNQGAIRLSKDSTFHARTKHIDIHFHFIRQVVELKQGLIKYVPTDDMIADIFTKSLARVKFVRFRSLLGLSQIPSS
jgi:hypothetical protein